QLNRIFVQQLNRVRITDKNSKKFLKYASLKLTISSQSGIIGNKIVATCDFRRVCEDNSFERTFKSLLTYNLFIDLRRAPLTCVSEALPPKRFNALQPRQSCVHF